jgi:hypothetical protein
MRLDLYERVQVAKYLDKRAGLVSGLRQASTALRRVERSLNGHPLASSLSFGPREDAGALSKRQRVEWAFETVLVAWLGDFRG